MSIMRIASAVALISVLGTPARAAEPLQPLGQWNVDFGDAHCVAMRSYGPRDKPITLALKPAPIGDVIQLTIVRGSASKAMNQYRGTLTVDRSAPVAVSLIGHPGAGGKMRATATNLTLATYQPIRQASRLRLFSPSEVDATFELSQMGPVARTLDRCIANLRRQWNLGEAAAAIKQAASAKQPLADFFSSADYPQVALHNDGSGTVQLMLLINESGRIASCMVTETSGFASLDAQSCIILTRRARYDPAIGVDGKPAKSGVVARIHWKK